MENTGATLTGKASVDKPWLQFYPEALRNVEVPTITVETFLRAKNPDENKIAFEYYGNKITWKEFWGEVDKAAKSLKILGFGEENRIPVFLQSVPAHFILLIAAERIGAADQSNRAGCRSDENFAYRGRCQSCRRTADAG